MTPLHCPLYTCTALMDCDISTTLAHHLVAPSKARDGDVVAIRHDYHATEVHFGREVVTYFVVRMNGALQFRTYRQLETSQQAPMAHLEMLMQEEQAFQHIVQVQVEGNTQLQGMTPNIEDSDSYGVYYLPGAIGIIKDVYYLENPPWTQDRLDEMMRLVLPESTSNDAAMAQCANLTKITRDMRDLVGLHYDSIDLPDFVRPDPVQFNKFDLSDP